MSSLLFVQRSAQKIMRSLLRAATLLPVVINGYSPVALSDDDLTNPSPAQLAVTQLLEARVGYEADAVSVEIQDAATRLSDCAQAAPFLPREDSPLWGRITVGVVCEHPPSPRYLQTRVIALGSYVTAATTVQPGTVIEPWMLRSDHGDLGALPARTLRDPSQAIGQEARQRLTDGAAVQEHQLRAPLLVTRGQLVTLEAQGSGFTIHREGEALDSAGRGEQVRVRISRQQTLTGTVISAGRVSTFD